MRIKRCFEKGDQLGAVQLMELVVLMRLRLQSVRPSVCAAPPEAVALTRRPPATLQQGTDKLVPPTPHRHPFECLLCSN